MLGTGLLNLGVNRCEVVANVPRSFFCTASLIKRGVKPYQCQHCWQQNQAPEAMQTHAQCIKTHRDIARWPFDRRPLSPAEEALWRYLYRWARGQARAVPSTVLRRQLSEFGFTDDKLRECPREMRAKGYLIVSCSRGFYVPVRNEEVLDFMRTQKSREEALAQSVKLTSRFLHCSPAKLAELGLPADGCLEEVG